MNEIFFNEIITFVECSFSNLNVFSICKDDRIKNKRNYTIKTQSANKLTEIIDDKQFNNILNRNLSLLHNFLFTNDEYTHTISDISDRLLESFNITTYEKYDEYAFYYDYKTIQQKTLMCYNTTFEESLDNYSYVINHYDEVCSVYRVPFYMHWSIKNSMTLKALVY